MDVSEDVLLYDTGHIPGAVKIDWLGDLWDDTIPEFVQPDKLAQLFERLGVSNDTTIVLYGDKNNWWASYAFWFFRYSGHENLKLMNGGRAKWVAEDRPLTTDAPDVTPGSYTPGQRNPELRAFRDDVLKHLERVKAGTGAMVDVRSPRRVQG